MTNSNEIKAAVARLKAAEDAQRTSSAIYKAAIEPAEVAQQASMEARHAANRARLVHAQALVAQDELFRNQRVFNEVNAEALRLQELVYDAAVADSPELPHLRGQFAEVAEKVEQVRQLLSTAGDLHLKVKAAAVALAEAEELRDSADATSKQMTYECTRIWPQVRAVERERIEADSALRLLLFTLSPIDIAQKSLDGIA